MPLKRLVQRFLQAGNVVPLGSPKKPRVPTVLIRGTKYVLSDYWPMLGSGEDAGSGGAKFINTGDPRFSYLWAYDMDRKVVAMWRYSDGDEKHFESASSSGHVVVVLERKGQLNRVTHEAFVNIEREMSKRQEDTRRALQKIIEENADDWDREVEKILKTHFEKVLYPEIDRRIKETETGIVPLGFKVNDNIPKSREDQLRVFVVTKVFADFNQDKAYDLVSKAVGYDAYEPPHGGDNQAVQWAYHDLVEKTYDKYLR